MTGAHLSLITFLGFETKGGENENDFFGTFDKVAVASGQDGNDGFDAAFDAGAWGEGGPPPADGAPASSSEDAAAEAPASGDDPPETGDSDAHKKDRSRRRRPGQGSGSGRSSRPASGVEAGVEAMHLGEGGDASKDRRSRPSRPDDAERRSAASGSGSHNSRRRPRSSRSDRGDGSSEELGVAAAPDKEKRTAPSKGPSFKKMFSRNKAPPPDP